MCQNMLTFLHSLTILTIAIFSTLKAQRWSPEAVDTAGLGECFDSTAGAYKPNAVDCLNDGETIPDPLAGASTALTQAQTLLPANINAFASAAAIGAGGPLKTPLQLCDTTDAGRFNLANLFPFGSIDSAGAIIVGSVALTDTTNTRNRLCSDPNQLLNANKCLRSCKRCCILPKFASCKDVLATPATCDVTKCNSDPNYALQLCPSTCGRCSEALQANPDTELCIDTATDCFQQKLKFLAAGQAACPATIEKTCALTCNNPSDNKLCKEFTTDMKAALATTAAAPISPPVPGGGPVPVVPGGGVDLATNCAQNKDLCTNPVYKDYMQKNCLVTCKSAGGGTGTSSTCQDKPHTNCVIWKRNGFCNNTFYSEDFRKENCGFTCKLC